MPPGRIWYSACGIALALTAALGGCAKLKQNDPRDDARLRAEAKRQQVACASPAANDQLKGILFDQAVSHHSGDRQNLDTLADYSLLRMENPVVKGWDPRLDITNCKGRLILAVPPGAERGFEGERQLQAEIDYTAQAAANGQGFVYQINGAEPVIAKLAAFNLKSVAYQPPPAIDEPRVGMAPSRTSVVVADMPPIRTHADAGGEQASGPVLPDPAVAPARPPRPEPGTSPALASSSGEATVRAFYDALGVGDGAAASAHIIPEKRSSKTFSPKAMSRFYGRLPVPIRLTQIAPMQPGVYRVGYHYSAGRSQCNGSAIVSVIRRDGRDLIRSIRALSGC